MPGAGPVARCTYGELQAQANRLSHALAAADAHGLHAEGLVRLLEVVDQGGHDAGAGHAERVTEGDGAAVDVHLRVEVDAQVTGRADDLAGERLVDLDEVDVVDGHACPLERLTACLDRSETHDLRVETGDT